MWKTDIDQSTGSNLFYNIPYSFLFWFQDATANDIPSDFDVQGYPTIYFKSKSGKLLPYDEDRTKENFVAFIEKNRDKTDKQADEQTAKQADEQTAKQADEQTAKQDSPKDEL